MRHRARARITSIVVERLFGFLDYEIPTKSSDDLIILYGDNGSGKTTILNLVFHALAPEDSRGHRSFIARLPFRRLAIAFADGHRVCVKRRRSDTGQFTMLVEQEDNEIASHVFTPDRDGKVREQADSTYRPLLHALSELGLGLFLLPDNRRIQSNIYSEDEESPRRYRAMREIRRYSRHEEGLSVEDNPLETIDHFVGLALQRATRWARSKALTATTQGETDTNKIYAEILLRIAGRTGKTKPRQRTAFADLLQRVEALRKRSTTFSRFGLVTPFAVKDLLPVLQRASAPKKGVITQVLSPYIRSFEARLDALEQLRETLETFSGIFASFYNYKTLTFNIRSGVQIRLHPPAAEASTEHLSSGEKQLLLLFCNVLLARSRPSVFIIDEPELSLNIKWQRELISALLACVKGCDVQFLFATHSLEMIAQHKESAVKLESGS